MDSVTPPSSLSFVDLIDTVTIGSFFLVLVLLFLAYALSIFVLPQRTTTKTRVIFIWHLFDSLIHFLFEGSFLYYSFFASKPTSLQGPSHHVLWGDSATVYGAAYSDAPLAKLWQEYAKADFRWGQSDIGVVTLEVLTVFVGGPLALWICDMIRKEDDRRWFWITVLATGELYGGWFQLLQAQSTHVSPGVSKSLIRGCAGYMTFMPEWLTGSHNLETSNFMYK